MHALRLHIFHKMGGREAASADKVAEYKFVINFAIIIGVKICLPQTVYKINDLQLSPIGSISLNHSSVLYIFNRKVLVTRIKLCN